MTTDQMKTFIVAARCLNFTKAADHLFITQSAVSRQIGALEAELSTQLFLRQNSQIRLTYQGDILYRGLSKIYDDYTTLLHSVQEASSGLTGTLRIGVLDDQTLEPWLINLLHQFIEERPNVRLSFIRLDLQEINQYLRTGDIDLGVTLFRGEDMVEDMTQYVYSHDQLYLAVPRRLFPSAMDPDAPETFENLLARLPLAMIAPGSFGGPVTAYAWDILKNLIIRTGIRFEASFRSLQDLIISGLYCTVVNESNILGQNIDMVFVTAHRFGTIRKGILWNSNSANSFVPVIVRQIQQIQSERLCPQQLEP